MMESDRNSKEVGALFVMPRKSSAWSGSEALWITVAGWSGAAKRLLGNAWVLTTDRIASPDEALHFPEAQRIKPRGRLKRWAPTILVTLLKDVELYLARNRKVYRDFTPWADTTLTFVWEQHDLFSGPGRKIATDAGVPFILYVHAPIVWEASRWGIKRPLWGRFIEFFFERRSLLNADIVACVSSEVADEVKRLGVLPSRIMVSPMSVDAARFTSVQGNKSILQKLNIENKVVVGWTGSFRGFHGLAGLVRAFRKVVSARPNATLVLVGDGAERISIEQLVDELGMRKSVVFAGRVPFVEIPLYVNAFDIAVVSASSGDSFHYSPLKLREYLAAGCAVLAPRAGEVSQRFMDESELLLYSIGNEVEMAEKMIRLIDGPELRNRIGQVGHSKVLQSGTWDHELNMLLKNLRMKGR